ncbi:MAG: hypothetical protein ACREID_00950, partial [Planctomycetota bacterium]
AEDGSFGDVAATGRGALVLLGEGWCSAQGDARGRAVAGAVQFLLDRAGSDEIHASGLTALVEDYVLSFEALFEEQRARYADAIFAMIRRMDGGEEAREALLHSELAGFPVPEGGRFPGEAPLSAAGRLQLLQAAPTRFTVARALARGPSDLPPDALVREWARPLFERAMSDLAAGREPALALLTLQAPYRL